MTTIKLSLIKNAGYGVFATRKYKIGDFVCFYDCEEKKITNEVDFTYSIKVPFNEKQYVGYTELREKDGTGQFINDFDMFDLNDDDRENEYGLFKISSIKINNKIQHYINASNSHSNVAFSNDITKMFKLYASKDINENEELYLHYGINYWISKIQITNDEPLTRLYCLLKNNALVIKNNKIYLENNIITPEQALYVLKILPNGNIINHFRLGNHTTLDKIKHLVMLLN